MYTEHELGSDLAAVSLALVADPAVLSLVMMLAEMLAFSVIPVGGAPRKTFARDAIIEKDRKTINDVKATINDVVRFLVHRNDDEEYFPLMLLKVGLFLGLYFLV